MVEVITESRGHGLRVTAWIAGRMRREVCLLNLKGLVGCTEPPEASLGVTTEKKVAYRDALTCFLYRGPKLPEP
jgi:hypothetical protein